MVNTFININKPTIFTRLSLISENNLSYKFILMISIPQYLLFRRIKELNQNRIVFNDIFI